MFSWAPPSWCLVQSDATADRYDFKQKGQIKISCPGILKTVNGLTSDNAGGTDRLPKRILTEYSGIIPSYLEILFCSKRRFPVEGASRKWGKMLFRNLTMDQKTLFKMTGPFLF